MLLFGNLMEKKLDKGIKNFRANHFEAEQKSVKIEI